MSEKEKSLVQCSHSVVAPFYGSSNSKSNSSSKSNCIEVLSNVVNKKTLLKNYQQSTK